MGKKIRALMMLQGISLREWSITNRFHYQAVYEVACKGAGVKSNSSTNYFKIKEALKRDGFWPEDEAVEVVVKETNTEGL